MNLRGFVGWYQSIERAAKPAKNANTSTNPLNFFFTNNNNNEMRVFAIATTSLKFRLYTNSNRQKSINVINRVIWL